MASLAATFANSYSVSAQPATLTKPRPAIANVPVTYSAFSAWSAGYTSWGSMDTAVDLLLGPDFTTTPTMMAVEFEPVLSVPKMLGTSLPEGSILSDVGLTAQLKGTLINERYQPIGSISDPYKLNPLTTRRQSPLILVQTATYPTELPVRVEGL